MMHTLNPFRFNHIVFAVVIMMTPILCCCCFVLLLSGCAEKRVPDDELVREYLYGIKSVELWTVSLNQVDAVNLHKVVKILDEKFLRKYMRISEMETDKYIVLCVEAASKAVGDPGFFMNNSLGRRNFEEWARFKANSLSEFDARLKQVCSDSLSMLKGRAEVREMRKRTKERTTTAAAPSLSPTRA